MAKTKTFIRQKDSAKNIRLIKAPNTIKSGMGVDTYNPTEALLDEERIGRAIWECLKNGDSEGVIEIIQIHLEACTKTRLPKESHLPKTTLSEAKRKKL
ncbi:MAG: hypothetical protein HZB76_00450 [Chlamydiae bacterium]|nr:hypothetical protein [Chlamydiota bacterium]